MSALLNLDSVSHQRGAKQLFRDVKLSVTRDTRLGIIGPNGSGKSTLMNILAGRIEPDAGRLVAPSSVRSAYVAQQDSFPNDLSVLKACELGLKGLTMTHDATVQASVALSRLGFSDLDRPVSELSGGWRKRLAIASALASEPDVLLLDEPTNHLDVAGLVELEALLSSWNGAWVVVSHDRYFLERTTREILEVAPYYESGVFKATGSYLGFKERRSAFLEQERKRAASLKNTVRTELEWASRSPKARTGKATFRLKQASKLESELKELRSRMHTNEMTLSFNATGRATRELVKLMNVSFAFENTQILKKESFKITGGMCLGVLGSNGQGKSTLLRLIGGELSPTTGKIRHADGLRIVYFQQMREALNVNETLREALGDGADHVIYGERSQHIIGWARRFGFAPTDLEKRVSELSGGEQARVLLSRLVRQEADLLILDEPSNDLDIAMLETLETMLLEFTGAVVLVTHDRFLLQEVCTHFVGFSDEQALIPFASYDQWEETVSGPTGGKRAKSSGGGGKKPKGKPKKLSYKDDREYRGMEKKILAAEEALEAVQARAADPASHADHETSTKTAKELSDAKEVVEKLYERWEELETLKSELEG